MLFATEIHSDDHAAALDLLSRVKEWSRPEGRHYFIAPVWPGQHELLEGCKRGFFVKIEPGGHLHRHTDASAAGVSDGELIIVATNPKCLTFWDDDGVEKSMHLALGKRYSVTNRAVPHWATNDGDTDRVDLVIEYAK